MTFVTIDDAPVINKRKKYKNRNNNKNRKRKNKKNKSANDKYGKHINRLKTNKNNDIDDETRFNSEEYHQKQHDL